MCVREEEGGTSKVEAGQAIRRWSGGSSTQGGNMSPFHKEGSFFFDWGMCTYGKKKGREWEGTDKEKTK